MTTIHSNGSKWFGQEPDSIDILLERLLEFTIEEIFFHKYNLNKYANGSKTIWGNVCPISKDYQGHTWFFGNFEEISGVFRIETTDEKLIDTLSAHVKANKGWKKYYEKHLVKEETV